MAVFLQRDKTINKAKIDLPKDKIADFCQRHHIRKLSLFGSVLREDFRFAGMERELSKIIGRKVDLRTPQT